MTRQRTYSPSDEVDAVVIGTGAGGAPVLATLAAAGLKVVALEAGRWWRPGQYVQDDVAMADLYWRDERLSGGLDPTAFGKNNSGCGVGGSTLHYGAYAPRPVAAEFTVRRDFGVGSDWPFTVADLAPYYDAAERFLGVSGPASYPWDRTRKWPNPPVPLNAPALLMKRGCDAIGVTSTQAPLLTLSRPYKQPGYAERPACAGCGYCHQGCFNASKASMDVTYLPMALSHGTEVRDGAYVHGFETHAGRVTAVIYRKNGEDHKQRCKAVFLCAGAVETPRLLLHAGLANGNGMVGRNFMVHVATQVWGTFDEATRPTKGFPASLITEDAIRAKDADFAGGYLMQSLGVVPLTWAVQVARGRGLWGDALVAHLKQFDRVAGIGVNGETLPYEHNTLTLSDEPDARGLMPKPVLRYTAGGNEKKMRGHADRLMRRIWDAAGAHDVYTFDRTAHTIGTCRMGDDPADSVVDTVGRSREIVNLWVSDNSTFPSSLAANPALTIIALALRSAEAFLKTGRDAI